MRHREADIGLPGRVAGSALGVVLAGLANAPAALPRRKPLHDRGGTWRGTWRVHAPWPEAGVDALAEAGERPVLARTSRAIGLPEPWPDITGLAVRLPGDGDLLLAGTGTGRHTRRVLAVRTPGGPDPLTTLLPLPCRLGRVDVGAQVDGRAVRVLTSLEGGPWTERAAVLLQERTREVVRFDPMRLPRGLAWSGFWARARRPAYALARRLAPDPAGEA